MHTNIIEMIKTHLKLSSSLIIQLYNKGLEKIVSESIDFIIVVSAALNFNEF